MSKTKIRGVCHICGQNDDLTFEHVPPRSAFNNQPIRVVPLLEAIEKDFDDSLKGDLSRRGLGAYTLCARCNNNTGAWYGSAFAKWVAQGADVLIRSNFNPRLIYLHYVEPLKVLKQIATMMFSASSERFQAQHPDLVKFVLNPEWKYLPDRYRFFVYFNHEGRPRTVGDIMTKIRMDTSNGLKLVPEPFHEITFPPYGYIMTTNYDGPAHPEMAEITYFKRFDFNEFEVAPLYLPVLPTVLPIPGDYRTDKQVQTDVVRNLADFADLKAEPPNQN